MGRLRESGRDPLGIAHPAVLAQLPLAFEPRDRDLDADDGLHERREILGRRVLERPRRFPPRLVSPGERFNVAPHEVRVVDESHGSAGVHGDVVPRGYDPAVFRLGRIHRGRHVRIGTREDHEALGRQRLLPVMRVRARDVAAQRPERSGAPVEYEREVRGEQAVGRLGDERPERMGLEKIVHHLGARLGEGRRQIHGGLSFRRAVYLGSVPQISAASGLPSGRYPGIALAQVLRRRPS